MLRIEETLQGLMYIQIVSELTLQLVADIMQEMMSYVSMQKRVYIW